jgi:hypothetical protein
LSYGAREYDPAIGRFFGVDPIIEQFPYLTPYNYASNDPVLNIDLWGLQGKSSNQIEEDKRCNCFDGPEDNADPNKTPGVFDRFFDNFFGKYAEKLLPQMGTSGQPLSVKQLKDNVSSVGYSPSIVKQPDSGENDNEDYDYFYRAMSLKEFFQTGGRLVGKPGDKGDCPFVTIDKNYLLNPKAFISKGKNARKYQIIVTYKTLSGTRNKIDVIALQHPMDNITEISRKQIRPIRKFEKGAINYGFPGQNGSAHFNPRVVGILIEPILRK